MSSSVVPPSVGGGDFPALVQRGGGGRQQARSGAQPKTWSTIVSMNTSPRDEKNVLEVRLEKFVREGSDRPSVRFSLSVAEISNLLTKLTIDGSHLAGVSACPAGKGVVYITLKPTVDITRFLKKEIYQLKKEGNVVVQTSIIRPAGKKEVPVTVTGLCPLTKDQAVKRYLAAHGKVGQSDRVIHHVWLADSGMLAGHPTGERTYMVEITRPMGSYHIIDGEKVVIRYRNQDKTCAGCHRSGHQDNNCPGPRVHLTDYM